MPLVSTSVWTPRDSPCTAMAMTTSSNEVFPARSPMPFTQSSTWRAPALTAAMALAEAIPRSFCPWNDRTAPSSSGTSARR